MKAGRKYLKRAAKDQHVTLQHGQTIVQVVSLRGSNLIQMQKASNFWLCFPAKFQKLMWIKKGNFIVVDDSGKEKALESGSKVACMVSRVLSYEQVRLHQKSPDWPEAFKTPEVVDDSSDKKPQQGQSTSQEEEGNGLEEEEEEESSEDDDDDDGLPPLEANTNRIRPIELYADSEDSDS